VAEQAPIRQSVVPPYIASIANFFGIDLRPLPCPSYSPRTKVLNVTMSGLSECRVLYCLPRPMSSSQTIMRSAGLVGGFHQRPSATAPRDCCDEMSASLALSLFESARSRRLGKDADRAPGLKSARRRSSSGWSGEFPRTAPQNGCCRTARRNAGPHLDHRFPSRYIAIGRSRIYAAARRLRSRLSTKIRQLPATRDRIVPQLPLPDREKKFCFAGWVWVSCISSGARHANRAAQSAVRDDRLLARVPESIHGRE